MNYLNGIILAAIAALLVAAICLWPALKTKGIQLFANIAEGIHENSRSLILDGTVSTKYLLAKQGATGGGYADVCGANDLPIGIITDEGVAADNVDVAYLNARNATLKGIASETIAVDESVYTAASGKLQDLPTTAGTYYHVGYARSAGAADAEFEFEPCAPRKVVVLGDTVGVSIVSIPINLASLANGDVLTNYTPGFAFKVIALDFHVTVPATTAAKLATLNAEIGSTNLTGGAVALTSANCTPLGAQVAGSAVTAANTGTSSDTISIEAASVTAFVEGAGVLLIKLQNLDTVAAHQV